MTVQQFGATIKQKYPQYQSKSDGEIGQLMLTKYPQYQSQIDKPPQKTTGQKATNALMGVSNVVGTTKLGQGLATVGSGAPKQGQQIAAQDQTDAQKITQAIHAQTDPVKKQRLVDFLKKQFGQSYQPITGGDINSGFNLSNKEILGSAAQTALGVGSFGIAAPESLAGKVAAGAGTGYAFDKAQQATDNKQITATPGFGTLTGALLPVASKVIGSGLKRVLGTTTGVGNKVLDRAVKNPDEVFQNMRVYSSDESKMGLVQRGKEAINDFLSTRNTEYGSKVGGLKETPAKSVISYVDKQGNKVYTQLTPDELAILRDEVKNIPSAKGASQIHLDAFTPNLKANAKEISRAEFLKGHPQAAEALGNTVKPSFTKGAKGLFTGSTSNPKAQPIVNEFQNQLKKFGGSVTKDGLKFNSSSLTASDRNALNDVWSEVQNWTDFTPQGKDNLRQLIGNYSGQFKAAGNTKADVVLGNLKKFLTSHIDQQTSGAYKPILEEYGQKTQLAKGLISELNQKGNAKPSTQLNSILKVFKKDPQVIDHLTQVMGQKEADKFLNQISGAVLSDWLPSSVKQQWLEGTLGATQILSVLSGTLGIGSALKTGGATLATFSPKVVGTATVGLGKLIQKGVGTGIQRTLTKLGSKANSR